MNVGIYLLNADPLSGGAYTFEESIINALGNLDSRHSFFVYTWSKKKTVAKKNVQFIGVERYISSKTYRRIIYFILRKMGPRKVLQSYKNKIIDHYIKKDNIHLFWFLSLSYVPVKVPFIFTVWDLQHRLQPYFPEVSISGWQWESREETYRTILPRASYVITGNEAGASEISLFYSIPRERIVILPHPTPDFALTADKTNSSHLSENQIYKNKYILYPAQFWPHKNHISILLALDLLKSKYSLNLKVIFTGSDKGNRSYIQSEAEKMLLTGNVTFMDFVKREELITLYKNALALVYPSFFGPENLPPLEAMALGCPVIASRVSGADEQFGDAAILFDPKNPKELADRIRSLVNDSKLRKRMITKGFHRASGWTSKDFAQGVVSLIDEFESIRRCWSKTKNYVHL